MCDKTFKLIDHLQRHNRSDHKIKIYKNSTKAKKNNNSNDKFTAIETENNALIQPCEHCRKIYNSESSLKQHILKEHGNLNLATIEEVALDITNRSHHDSLDKYTVNDADFTISQIDLEPRPNYPKILFPSEAKSTDVIETEHKNTFPCLHCAEQYQSINELSKHIKERHLKVKKSSKFKCQICHEHFVTSKTRTEHVAAAHKVPAPVPVPIHKCTVCGKKFRKLSNLQKHVEVLHASLFDDSD